MMMLKMLGRNQGRPKEKKKIHHLRLISQVGVFIRKCYV